MAGDGLCAGPQCRWRRWEPCRPHPLVSSWPGQLCGFTGCGATRGSLELGHLPGRASPWVPGPACGAGDAATEPSSPQRIQSCPSIVRGAVHARPSHLTAAALPAGGSHTRGQVPAPRHMALLSQAPQLCTSDAVCRRTVTLLFGGLAPPSPLPASRVHLGAATRGPRSSPGRLPVAGALTSSQFAEGRHLAIQVLSSVNVIHLPAYFLCGDVLNTLRQLGHVAQWLSVDR